MLVQGPWGLQGEPTTHSSTSGGGKRVTGGSPVGFGGAPWGEWGEGTCTVAMVELEALAAGLALEGAQGVDALLARASKVVLTLVNVCVGWRGWGTGMVSLWCGDTVAWGGCGTLISWHRETMAWGDHGMVIPWHGDPKTW